MKKKILILLLSLSLLITMVSPTLTTVSALSGGQRIETETDYAALEADIQTKTFISDTQKVSQLTELFFTAKEDNFVSAKEVDFTNFYSPGTAYTADTDTNLTTINKLFAFEKRVRQEICDELSYESFDVTIQSVDINDKTATVVAYEYYEYSRGKQSDLLSSRGNTYTITYTKMNNEWKITNIETDSELEALVADVDDISVLFQEYEPTSDPAIEQARIKEAQLRALGNMAINAYTLHWYSGVQALTYAKKYSSSTSGTGSYNSLFPSYEDNDCQNFVSQCVWAGLGGSNTSTAVDGKKYPMITDESRAWWSTSTSTSSNWTWTYVPSFAEYVDNGGSNILGLYGSVGSKGNIANGYAGDIVQICNSSGTWYHTYIIVQANGTSGSRGLSDYYICAHTTNRNNEQMSSFLGSAANLRLVKVTGSYY